ncbi:hypothetical protein BV22DRAFT_1054729 [Leucogyrophana mollusca]|uniref:Uncharacterized protein n=1 Tax=Leucogyrophana mollusca TaxID=85980 RepID=A0ACB8BZ60_9AGAM|nr:hypothetical protein BV22DRAFT_1054729 [Leucogyrophana mollusca]
MDRNFSIKQGTSNLKVTRRQFPITSAYAFTDYRAQGQTISNSLVDIATPPSGGLTPFNIYVSLSRGHGRDNDERLAQLDSETEKWWHAREVGNRVSSTDVA